MYTVGTANSLIQYNLLKRTMTREKAVFEKQPDIKRAMEHFEKNAPKVETLDALLKDRRILEFSLSAFQLEDQINAKALIKKILTEPLDDPKSLVNRLLDPRYKGLAQFFEPLVNGEKPFSKAAFRTALVNSYKINEFEKYEGQKNEALREVMYFERNIGSITSLPQLMSDRVLSKVARGSLGLPDSFAALEYDQQKARLTKMLDVSKFKDPAFTKKFIEQYLVKTDLKTLETQQNPLSLLFQPSGDSAGGMGGFSLNLLV